MTKNYVNKMLIEAALGKAIKDLQSDPEQTIRRWCEKGSAKASKSGQAELFQSWKTFLHNRADSYTGLIETMVKETETERLKTLALNFSYYAFTLGKETRKEQELRYGAHIPFTAFFELDGTVTASHVKAVAEQGKKLGIYTYQLFCRTERAIASLPELFAAHKECVFLVYLKPAFVTKALADDWKAHRNCLPFLLSEDGSGAEALALFRSRGILCGACLEYDAAKKSAIDSGAYLESAAKMGAPLFALWPKRGVSAETMREVSRVVTQQRLTRALSAIPFDVVGDILEADRLLSSESAILYFDSKGQRLCVEAGYQEGNENLFHNSFIQILEALL